MPLTKNQQNQIRNGQIEEVVIGGRMHSRMSYDNDAYCNVTQEAGEEYEHVGYGDGDGQFDWQMRGSPLPLQILERLLLEIYGRIHHVLKKGWVSWKLKKWGGLDLMKKLWYISCEVCRKIFYLEKKSVSNNKIDKSLCVLRYKYVDTYFKYFEYHSLVIKFLITLITYTEVCWHLE